MPLGLWSQFQDLSDRLRIINTDLWFGGLAQDFSGRLRILQDCRGRLRIVEARLGVWRIIEVGLEFKWLGLGLLRQSQDCKDRFRTIIAGLGFAGLDCRVRLRILEDCRYRPRIQRIWLRLQRQIQNCKDRFSILEEGLQRPRILRAQVVVAGPRLQWQAQKFGGLYMHAQEYRGRQVCRGKPMIQGYRGRPDIVKIDLEIQKHGQNLMVLRFSNAGQRL